MMNLGIKREGFVYGGMKKCIYTQINDNIEAETEKVVYR